MIAYRSQLFVISLLGSLSVISPFAIDMYLPAFQDLSTEFGVPTTTISLTLSSYFIGLALGQLLYGPLLDRFGRKPPLAFGLSLFVLASLGCAFAPDITTLIGLRFFQALGGCVAQVASVAMVRDFFPRSEAARVLSRLFLFIAISPLLAPTVGGLVIATAGWPAAFLVLGAVATAILTLVLVQLPEGHRPDAGISLHPWPILVEYFAILRHPRFATYGLAGAFSFAGLFTYVAGSPILFMDGFGVSKQEYSLIFALLAAGFIGGSQLNVVLLRRLSSETLFLRLLILQVLTGLIYLIGAATGGYGLTATLILLFIFLGCVGITNPNASALAISPFSRNAGSASALLGFFQLGVGAVISTGIGAASPSNSLPIIAILAGTAVIGLMIVLTGRKRALASPVSEHLPHSAAYEGVSVDQPDHETSSARAPLSDVRAEPH